MADGDNSVDALREGFGEASAHLAAAGSDGEDDAKISMKWDKNWLPDGLPCKTAGRERQSITHHLEEAAQKQAHE